MLSSHLSFPVNLATIIRVDRRFVVCEVYCASPVNTSTRQVTQQAKRDGLHVLEMFGGIGVGVLRTALASSYSIRCYTYVDRDATSRRIAKTVLQNLQRQRPNQLPDTATQSFEKRLPQFISLCNILFLANLVARNRPVDLLGGSWECQSVSKARRRQGAMDLRFKSFNVVPFMLRCDKRKHHSFSTSINTHA